MKSLAEEIISRRDDILTCLVKSNFDVELSSIKMGNISINGLMSELGVLLQHSIVNFNENDYSLHFYFTRKEIDVIQGSLAVILQSIENTFTQLTKSDGTLVYFDKNTIQLNDDVFDMPNLFGSARDKQLRPRTSLQIKNLVNELERIKPLLRAIVYKGGDERQESLRKIKSELLSLERLKLSFLASLESANRSKERSEKILGDIEVFYSEVEKINDETVRKRSDLEGVIVQISEQIKEMKKVSGGWNEGLTNLKGLQVESDIVHKKINELYDSSVDARRKFFTLSERADEIIENSSLSLEFFDAKITEIDEVNKKANSVLNLAGTVGLGRFFDDQYNESKKSISKWLFACAILLIAAVGTCVWALWNFEKNNEVLYLASRLSVIPLVLGGLWFCANQYIKQKHIIEDYAYKRVLALSMVSFRNEINDVSPEGVSAFIKSILSQLHQPPLDSLDKSHYKDEVKILKGLQSEVFKDIIETFSVMKDRKNKKGENT